MARWLLGIAIWSINPYFIPEPDAIDANAHDWKRRSLLHRAQDSALYLFNEVL